MSFSEPIEKLVLESASSSVAVAPWWKRVPLIEIANILNGYPWESAKFNDQKGVPLIRIRDITSGKTDTYYDGDIADGYWIDNGDLLVGMDGDFNVRIWSGGRALLNQRVCKISPVENLYQKRFLAAVLPGYLKLINEKTNSVTVKHLSSKTIGEIPLPLPPLAEQRRIVAKIESLTAKSKRAREHLDHIPRLVEKYKQAVLSAAIAGRLSSSGSTGAVWQSVSVSKLFDWSSGKNLPTKKQNEGDVPVIGGNGITGYHDAALIDFPTVVIGRVGALCGNVHRSSGKAWITDNAIYAKTISPQVSLDFAALFFKNSKLNSLSGGSGQPYVNQSTLNGLQMPLPAMAEQKEIVGLVKCAFAWIDRLEKEAVSARKLVDALDKAILAKAFRGELVPQDPNDEPAEALLARIKAERAARLQPRRGRTAKVK